MRRLYAAALAVCAAAPAFAAELYVPGTLSDPHVRTANYLDKDGRHFSALIELRQLDANNDPRQMPMDYQLALADNYLAFGMGNRAESLYRYIALKDTDVKRVARAQFRLAQFDYQRGYLSSARATLYQLQDRLPDSMLPEWQDLLSRVLMTEGKYGEAATVLTDKETAAKQSSFARYNLGVALINDGRTAQGQTVLDRVGRLVPDNDKDLALRDRANLSLGWHFLQTQQGGTAKPVLSRVRVKGPFSNRALLGLGWAELAPQGERVKKVDVGDEQGDASPFTTFSTLGVLLHPESLKDDIFRRAGLADFRLNRASKQEEVALRKALVPWVELISRDPMDTAVQEAWLAIPYTLDRLGAHTQALQYYEKAVDVLENARKRMDVAMMSIKQGRMVETIVRRDVDSEAGWDWKLRDLPDAPETYFLQHLLAGHRFQEALKNYRDVRMMARSLDAWSQRLATAEIAYTRSDRKPGNPKELIAKARQNWTPPWQGLQIELHLEQTLSAPSRYSAQLPAQPTIAPALQLAAAPARFNGPAERARAAQQRIATLREQLALAGADESRFLDDMAIDDLTNQKKQIERYLVEARFALARLYDRQRKGTLDEQ